jgi:hypothetical protein
MSFEGPLGEKYENLGDALRARAGLDPLNPPVKEEEKLPCGCPEGTPVAQVTETAYQCWSCNEVWEP